MGALDRFEKSVERLMNNAFAKVGRGGEVKAVELASRLRREIDDRAAVVGRDRTVAPNEFSIDLSPPDFEQVQNWGAETLADELATNLTEYAASQHYAFVGPVSVTFERHDELTGGRFQIRSATVRGNVAPATNPAPSTRHPLIDIDGQRYLLTGPVTVIGRDAEADIVVDDPGVSRGRHRPRVDERPVRGGTPGPGRDTPGREHADHRPHPHHVLDRHPGRPADRGLVIDRG
jgi:hypothetical protein